MGRFQDEAQALTNQWFEEDRQAGEKLTAEPSVSKNIDDLTEKFTRVPNGILDKAMSFGFTRCELLVVLAVIRQTCGWNKPADWLSYSRVAELTGLEKRNVRRMMLRLKKGRVLRCGEYQPAGYPRQWSLEKNTDVWDYEGLRRLRKKSEASRKKRVLRDETEGRVKSTHRGRVRVTPGGEGRSYPPQKTELNTELKTELKTLRAAFAARASSSSSLSKPEGEKGAGSIWSPKDPPSVERPSPVIETQMAPCDQVRIVQLCGELEAGGVNSYPWVGGKRRKGVLAAHIIRVLEKAVVQRPGAAEFDVFAEKVFGEICSSG
ncbi:MAG: replication protein [Candidatus Eisenbacteria bacterium]|nr:replication protein [Candidatus Eisenbacteria bacterium]